MQKYIDYTTGNKFKKILKASIPLIFLNLLTLFYNSVDYFWLDRIDMFHAQPISQIVISCVGSLSMLLWLARGVIEFVRPGFEYYVSKNIGAKHLDGDYQSWISNGVILSIVISFIFCILLWLFQDQIINFLTLGDNYNYAHQYIITLIPTLLLLMINMILSSCLLVIGHTLPIFIINGFGLLLNLFLDPYLILKLRLEIFGAGLSNIISALITCIILILFLKYYKVNFNFKLSFTKMKQILVKSFPIAIGSIVFTIVSMMITSLIVSKFGDAVNSVKTIGSTIEGLSWNVFGLAIAQIICVYVAQNVGANQIDFFKAINNMVLIVSVITIIISIIMFTFPSQLFSIFTDNNQIQQVGVGYLKILSISQLFMSYEALYVGMINGLGKTKYNYIISLMYNIILVIIIFNLKHDVNLLWIMLAFINILRGLKAVFVFKHLKQQYLNKEVNCE